MGSTSHMTSLVILASCAQGVSECNDNGSNLGGLLIVGTVMLLGLLALALCFSRIRTGTRRKNKQK